MKLKLLVVTIFFTLSSTVNADILCVKNNQKVSKNKVNLSSVIKVVKNNICPSGYKPIVDTASFKGEQGLRGDTGLQGVQGERGLKGDNGLPAISYSTCQKKVQESVIEISNINSTLPNFELKCDADEYVYLARQSTGSSCSVDWSYEYTDNLGNTNTDCLFGDPTPDMDNSKILDDSEMFVVGHKVLSGIGDLTNITGTMTTTRKISLTCCRLGD